MCIDLSDDYIDVRDITARVDELREERDDLNAAIGEAQADADDALLDELHAEPGEETEVAEQARQDTEQALQDAHDALNAWDDDNAAELAELENILDDLAGYGGSHQWEGDWYPAYLIADHAFEDYAHQLAEDIGAIDRDAAWPARCIDWKQAASELKHDYSTTEIQGETYWYR